MTESDVTMSLAEANDDSLQLKDKQQQIEQLQQDHNGVDAKLKDALPDSMDVDEDAVGSMETEEDDSQITSSTENGHDGAAEYGKDDAASDHTSTAENTKDSNDIDSSTVKSNALMSNENSSNACDHNSLNEKSRNSNGETNVETEDCSQSNDAKIQKPVADESTEETVSQPSNGDGCVDEDVIEKLEKLNDESSIRLNSDNESNKLADRFDPLGDIGAHSQNSNSENGSHITPLDSKNDAGVVNLDDSDDDEKPVEKISSTQTSNGKAHNAGSKVPDNDSDGAVVIGSDSEAESEKPVEKPKVNTAPVAAVDDDDDDDCVVIEDDTPMMLVPNDLSKRKNFAIDGAMNSDDSQPPSKRQRNSDVVTPIPNTMGQLTIKDARSLMPNEAAATGKRAQDMASIYPVNIAPATSSNVAVQESPPKLVPVGLSAGNPTLGTLTGLNTNANLLPGLTDDMFVLEAPSFIVPYIYEKPPADSLKSVVKEIEVKLQLSKEDLAQAETVDEFDMMTEQNKDDKAEKSEKKKKKKGRNGDEDESWSEESDGGEDDDESEDSEGGMKTKVLIKEANNDLDAIKSAIKPATIDNSMSTAKPGADNYFESPLGKFFMDIGVGLVQEFVQSDLIRLQKRKMRKCLGKDITVFERAIAALSGNVEASKKKNAPFKFTMKRCEFCNFKSESALSMANHYETPHMNGIMYKCNFCVFEIRNATEIVYHMEAVHNIKARLVKPLPYHQCPNCGFEDNGKAKLARHQPVCAKKFRPEFNLAPPNDWEAPAKIPRIKPRHGLVGTATAYQAMAAQAAAQKAALAASLQQQQQARNLQAAALAAQAAANKMRAQNTRAPKPSPAPPVPTNLIRSGAAAGSLQTQVRNPMAGNIYPNNYQLPAGGQITQQTSNSLAKKALSGQPSISITPLPRQTPAPSLAAASTSKALPAGMKPGQSPSGNKAQFVICEICDGYIKDLEQLRNHMQWMHKVKIHPKMIYNRPPLNCQKCQFRFFTDQGLERHLLGSHGLVTSSMQEAANKGKDAGRCPVCGRMYQWKLLNHVSRDHHMTLKPAHLSYKCTVCTATFGMYKQFETHVYTAHSTVAKKAMDGKKNSSATAPTASNSMNQRNSLNAANDSLLKPLKINDEITIIPQPASKSRITNMESHVID